MLRSGALKDPEVIALIERSFVPVWVNVRRTPMPSRPWLADVLVNARVDEHRMIADLFSQGFFVRSIALSPDGNTLLVTKPRDVAGSLKSIAMGDNAYAITDPGDYRSMLRHALEKLESMQHESARAASPQSEHRQRPDR